MECKPVQSNAASQPPSSGRMYVRTPLIESRPLQSVVGCPVYLKLENTQTCGSFKIRGISNLIVKKLQTGCKRLVASSGGNAGMAAAHVARQLNVHITLFVPSSTNQQMIDRLTQEGAEVRVHGNVWDDADAAAQQFAQDPTVGYVPPFDHPDIWDGHAPMIEEIAEDLQQRPDLVIVSVGGGGLLLGVARGMERVGWRDVPILAMETEGANCFNAAVKADKLVTLPAITSIAKCLGALTVAPEALRVYKQRPIISEVITDKECVDATLKFLDDHRILVEPACAASLAAFYAGVVRRLQFESRLPEHLNCIVVVVCGGACVNMKMLSDWQQTFGL